MTRQEIYKKIKDEGLAESIKKAFGKSYTNVKTEDLERWIKTNDFISGKMDHILEKTSKYIGKPETVNVNQEFHSCPLYEGFKQLISTLVAHRAITPVEGDELMDCVFK